MISDGGGVPASSGSDGALIEKVRAGGDAAKHAYTELWKRHVDAARRLARQVASQSEADDLVSEAFTRVLALLSEGRGPTYAFRPYLLTAVRRAGYDRANTGSRAQPVEDLESLPNIELPFRDTAVEGEERRRIVAAFQRLPERHQAVLWHTEIEREKPAKVAPILGVAARVVSTLAHRARRALAAEYLQGHLRGLDEHDEACRVYVDKLAEWVRVDLGKRAKKLVDEHVEHCDRCAALAAELATINTSLIPAVGPMVVGTAATGYLPAAASSWSLSAVGRGPRNTLIGTGVAAAVLAAVLIALAASREKPAATVATPPSPPAARHPAVIPRSSAPPQPPVPTSSAPSHAPSPTPTTPQGLPAPSSSPPPPTLLPPVPVPVVDVDSDVTVKVGAVQPEVRADVDLWTTGQRDIKVNLAVGLSDAPGAKDTTR